jgi:hypothetical protein
MPGKATPSSMEDIRRFLKPTGGALVGRVDTSPLDLNSIILRQLGAVIVDALVMASKTDDNVASPQSNMLAAVV